MEVFVGLDGGGTACRAQAELGDGRRTQILTGGAANVATDFDAARREIASLLARVLDAAQELAPEATLAPPSIVLGLAGASETGAATRLGAALPGEQVAVQGDIEVSLWGAFNGADGIVLAVGTGSVLGRNLDGRIHRLGGYGFMLGDVGSGAWIGHEALRRTLDARDGLGPRTALTAELSERFDGVAGLIGFANRARPADYAALAPLVLEHDRASCPVAGAILDQGSGWLLHALRKLLDDAPDLPVAPTGGLGPVLLERITAQGGAHLHCIAPKGTALDGALWSARHGAATGVSAS